MNTYSWEESNDSTKMKCYKGYPDRGLPAWGESSMAEYGYK